MGMNIGTLACCEYADRAASHAHPVADPTEVAEAMTLLGTRYPEYAAFPMPKPEEIAIYRLVPKVISLLDYSKGFGHSDLVTI